MKMIDIWSVVTMSIPFFEVVLHTFLDVLRKEKDDAIEEKGRQIKLYNRLAYP